MYEYACKLVKIVDGDTMDLDVNLGFHVTHRIRVRLSDIDTPEVTGWQRDCGLAATEAALEWFQGSDELLYVATQKTGKYGRWLARIFRYHNGEPTYLNDHLINGGWEKDRFHQ